MKLTRAEFLWAIGGAGMACAQVAHQHHPPETEEYAKVLEDPTRDKWQKPQEVVKALGLKPSDVVADIGAGTGYFSRRLAEHAAKVYAVDIDSKLLEIARSKSPSNVETIVAQPDDPKLPNASVDLVFFCDVLHHIDDRQAYYRKLIKALKPGGRIVNVDFQMGDLPVGPPPKMKLSAERVKSELNQAGFTQTSSLTFLPYQYFLIFQIK